MTDRTRQPQIHGVALPQIQDFSHEMLDNGAHFHCLLGGTQPITQIDIVTKGGVQYAPKAYVGAATCALTIEGTRSYTSQQIADTLDYYGAYISQRCSNFNAIITIFVLSKHLRHILPILEESIKYATFPTREFEIYKQKTAHDIAINHQTPSFMARQKLKEIIYAEGSRYARIGTVDTLQALTVDDVMAFYNKTFTPEDARIFISGRPNDGDIELVAKTFSENWTPIMHVGQPAKPEYRSEPIRIFTHMPSATQTSVAVGRRFPTTEHEDNLPMAVVDTIFGGYFGSRLMQNIREEKGLTYGIGSSISNNPTCGMHVIMSDVHPDKAQVVVDEIFNEMRRLHREPVGEEELTMVRNYMRGELLRSFDHIFASADMMLNQVLRNQDATWFTLIFNKIATITPEEIMHMAQKYLTPEAYSVSLAGPKQ